MIKIKVGFVKLFFQKFVNLGKHIILMMPKKVLKSMHVSDLMFSHYIKVKLHNGHQYNTYF